MLMSSIKSPLNDSPTIRMEFLAPSEFLKLPNMPQGLIDEVRETQDFYYESCDGLFKRHQKHVWVFKNIPQTYQFICTRTYVQKHTVNVRPDYRYGLRFTNGFKKFRVFDVWAKQAEAIARGDVESDYFAVAFIVAPDDFTDAAYYQDLVKSNAVEEETNGIFFEDLRMHDQDTFCIANKRGAKSNIRF